MQVVNLFGHIFLAHIKSFALKVMLGVAHGSSSAGVSVHNSRFFCATIILHFRRL